MLVICAESWVLLDPPSIDMSRLLAKHVQKRRGSRMAAVCEPELPFLEMGPITRMTKRTRSNPNRVRTLAERQKPDVSNAASNQNPTAQPLCLISRLTER